MAIPALVRAAPPLEALLHPCAAIRLAFSALVSFLANAPSDLLPACQNRIRKSWRRTDQLGIDPASGKPRRYDYQPRKGSAEVQSLDRKQHTIRREPDKSGGLLASAGLGTDPPSVRSDKVLGGAQSWGVCGRGRQDCDDRQALWRSPSSSSA
jgi:hypothetical protein